MDTYDFVVVGAGSAGSAVAARLSEASSQRVAVLEAGSRAVPPALAEEIANPGHWGRVQHTVVDWEYETVPQQALNGRRVQEPRGRLPGGSSNLYALMHIRGHASDFDNWAYNGCPGWSYQDVLPYFRKLEDQEDDTNPTAGKGGPLRLQAARLHQPNPCSEAFINACVELGYPRTEDFNGPQMEGCGWHHVNIKDDKRHSMDVAYLYPAMSRSPNLTLIDDAQVARLRFEGKRCVGADYIQGGERKSVRAEREVIVCCGAIDTPKLLLLSGIGNAAQLEQFGIPVLEHLPGVGENFHNHVLAPVVCTTKKDVPPPHQNLTEAAMFYKSAPGWVGPDMQMAFAHAAATGDTNNILIMLPGVVRPVSRGWVRLASADPFAKPLINPAYLTCEADLRRLTDAVRLARRLFQTTAFAEWVQAELAPGPNVPDDRVVDYVRQAADCYHHQAGSCKMGSDAMAVVDPQLRVYGIEGLRLADASVMPTVPSGNCHAGIVMIAEKVADLIKAAHRL